MRVFLKLAAAGVLSVGMAGSSLASAVLFDWQGQGKSEVFTIGSKIKSWTAAWECDPRSSPSIAIVRADNGVAVDFLGASYKGEKLLTRSGRFQLNAGNIFCRVTVTPNG